MRRDLTWKIDLVEEKDRQDMITAALLTQQAATYPMEIDGTTVIVLGFVRQKPDGLVDSTPLAILASDEVFNAMTPVDR